MRSRRSRRSKRRRKRRYNEGKGREGRVEQDPEEIVKSVLIHAVVQPSMRIKELAKREITRNDDQTPPHNNHKLYNGEHSRA